MSKKIFVSQSIPDSGIERLRMEDGVEVDYNDSDVPLDTESFLKRAYDCDGILSLLSDKIGQSIISSLKNCRVIANYAVGYDNIDVAAATRKRMWVTNTPDILTPATADLAFALMLSVSRRIVEAHTFCCEGKFEGWKSKLLLGSDLNGSTLGIIGMGRIGQAFARRALPFGMKFIYFNRNRVAPEIEEELQATWVSLDELVQASHYISLHCPGGAGTKHILSRDKIAMMKKEAIVINTARGTAIDEEALCEALSNGKIRGAGLDVFEREPIIFEELKTLSNVVLAPHIGSATLGTRSQMAVMAAENILSALNEKTPPQAVNPDI